MVARRAAQWAQQKNGTGKVKMSDETLSWGDCPSCGEYVLFKFHNECKPEWQWRTDDDPPKHGYDPWCPVRAWNWTGAAERAAEIYDEGDYSLSKGHDVVIVIRNVEGEERKFKVSAEAVPQYYVEQVP